MKLCRKFSQFLALLVVLFGVTACFQREFRAFEHSLTADEGRSLYQPLVSGQQQLLVSLDTVQFEALIFSWQGGKVMKVEEDLAEKHLLDEAKILFFKAEDQLFYFNPRKLRIEYLSPFLEGAEAVLPGSDLFKDGADIFTVVRSLTRPTSGFGSEYDRDLFRISFRCRDGAIFVEGAEALTSGPGVDFMPEPFPERRSIFFLRQENDSRPRLMAVDLDSGAIEPVIPDQNYTIKYPCRLADGRLAVSADQDGYFRLYELTSPDVSQEEGLRTMSLSPLEPPFPLPPENPGRLTLVTSGSGEGREVGFALAKIPVAYDLKAICALVTAQNHEINRKRALLAAALVQARQARFANWPVLDWGLFYTPDVGVFLDDPVVSSGDFLAQGISRGILGIVQPLLDFKKNNARERAEYFRAELAHDAVLNEVNERLTEAAGLYFEAQHLKRLMICDKYLQDTGAERLRYYQKLRARSEASLEEILATEQLLAGINSEQDFHAARLQFLISRLKEMCALPENAPFTLLDENFYFQEFTPEPLARLRHTALLHHPNLQAATATLLRSFFLEKAGSEQGPSAFFGASYGQSRRHFNDPVDDYISLAVQGKYPLSAFKNDQEQQTYWAEMRLAFQLERQARTRQVATALEEALLDFRAAQQDYDAKQLALLFRQESLRVSQLQVEYGVEDEKKSSSVNLAGARLDYLEALARLSKTRMDLGLRYAKIWRELGLAARLPEESAKLKTQALKHDQPSLWLWHTEEVIQSEDSIREFIRFCREHDIRRVYAYLYSESNLLGGRLEQEKMKVFLSFCAAEEIQVWGLLGEPEWLETQDRSALHTALQKLLAFNQSRDIGQPGFAGVKLDLEPHSLPGWHTDTARRTTLTESYRGLLAEASASLRGNLPLWVDFPVRYLKPDHVEMLDIVSQYATGVTLMCYFNDETKIIAAGKDALQLFALPLEIGLELSPQAPAGDSLPRMSGEKFRQFTGRLIGEAKKEATFSGLSLHDYRGAVEYFRSPSQAVQ